MHHTFQAEQEAETKVYQPSVSIQKDSQEFVSFIVSLLLIVDIIILSNRNCNRCTLYFSIQMTSHLKLKFGRDFNHANYIARTIAVPRYV